jgi:hypothetical protein
MLIVSLWKQQNCAAMRLLHNEMVQFGDPRSEPCIHAPQALRRAATEFRGRETRAPHSPLAHSFNHCGRTKTTSRRVKWHTESPSLFGRMTAQRNGKAALDSGSYSTLSLSIDNLKIAWLAVKVDAHGRPIAFGDWRATRGHATDRMPTSMFAITGPRPIARLRAAVLMCLETR